MGRVFTTNEEVGVKKLVKPWAMKNIPYNHGYLPEIIRDLHRSGYPHIRKIPKIVDDNNRLAVYKVVNRVLHLKSDIVKRGCKLPHSPVPWLCVTCGSEELLQALALQMPCIYSLSARRSAATRSIQGIVSDIYGHDDDHYDGMSLNDYGINHIMSNSDLLVVTDMVYRVAGIAKFEASLASLFSSRHDKRTVFLFYQSQRSNEAPSAYITQVLRENTTIRFAEYVINKSSTMHLACNQTVRGLQEMIKI